MVLLQHRQMQNISGNVPKTVVTFQVATVDLLRADAHAQARGLSRAEFMRKALDQYCQRLDNEAAKRRREGA